jgi:LysM repeat protein
MSKWLMLVCFTFIASNVLRAQQNKLEIRGTGQGIYLEHVVTPKENFYSVGRMFNINPKELAAYNHLHFASGLNIGEVLKIPLTKTNFTQEEVAQPNEVLIPVYHTVVAGETLYRLGVNYNKVSLASLKKWNNLSSDGLSVGTPMIIGFLKVNKDQSSLAKGQAITDVAIAPQTKKEKAEEKPAEIKSKKTGTAQVPTTVNTESEQPEPQATAGSNTNVTVTPTSAAGNSADIPTGYFKNLYEKQTSGNSTTNKNGTAGVFKSTSGWQDAKYYCFSNDAAAGTILKITDNATGKSVYAKVLDAIPDISQNDGLITVISNAAAEHLGAGDNKFDCTVTFARQ